LKLVDVSEFVQTRQKLDDGIQRALRS